MLKALFVNPSEKTMAHATLEHANITVARLEPALEFLLAALPGWRIRGQGRMDWFGKTIGWLHVGDDHTYLALQDGGEGSGPRWDSHGLGTKHLGFVVDDLDGVVARLQAAGHAIDHWGVDGPVRRSVYFSPPGLPQVEFVSYATADAAARNRYD